MTLCTLLVCAKSVKIQHPTPRGCACGAQLTVDSNVSTRYVVLAEKPTMNSWPESPRTATPLNSAWPSALPHSAIRVPVI